MLDLCRSLRRRDQGEGKRHGGGHGEREAVYAKEGIGHERFSSRLAVGVPLIRYPVTERFLSSHFCAAARTCSAVTARMRSGQLRMSSMLRPVVSAPPYQRASVAWLSWA